MLFGRIWERLGVADVLTHLLKESRDSSSLSSRVRRRAASAIRLGMTSGSRCWSWIRKSRRHPSRNFDLHHFYRAMAWLEEVEEKPEGRWQPPFVSPLIEEKLFDRRRESFTDLSIVFMDTTSLGLLQLPARRLGEHGYSRTIARPEADHLGLSSRRRRRAADLHRGHGRKHPPTSLPSCLWGGGGPPPHHRPGLGSRIAGSRRRSAELESFSNILGPRER